MPSPPRRFNFVTRIVCLAVLAFFSRPFANATTVIPPEFDALVQQADYVVRGKVTAVTSEWRVQNGHRNIVTLVSIEVLETIAGTPPSPLVIQTLGGKVGDKKMVVDGSPSFAIGDEHILFIRGNGVQFNPLVALMHGQYPIKKDVSGLARVTRSDGSPLRDEKEVSLPIETHPHATTPAENAPQTAASAADVVDSGALTATEFATRIRASRHKSAAAHAK